MNTTNILFPVKVPYSTAPDILKLKEDFSITPITEAAHAYKLNQQAIFPNDLFGELQSDELRNCIEEVAKKYNLPKSNSILDLAMLMEEDFAILALGKVVAICFCSPSGFIPSNILGKSFFEIHQPIPDAELLLKMSDKMGAVLSDNTRGPYRRYVWSITANPSGNQHPSLKNNFHPTSIDELFFRTEVQTTVPLGDHVHALFFIKVNMIPLALVWKEDSMRKDVLDSIDSMSDAMLDYKNLKAIKSILNNSK